MAKRITDYFGAPVKKRAEATTLSSDESSKDLVAPLNASPHGLRMASPNLPSDNLTQKVEGKEGSRGTAPVMKTPGVAETSSRYDILPQKEECKETEWYRGCKADVPWLLSSYPNVLEKTRLGRRQGLKCAVCYRHIAEAKKYSRNGQVPMADGVRSDGKKELKRIIDHLKSDGHNAAVCAEESQKLWLSQSDKHPWVNILKSHEAETVSQLIELAVDVHNDSKQMTLSANSWPSRSLAKMHSNKQISVYREHGLDASFCEFNPPASAFHYRDPNVYREMLDTVAEVVMEATVQEIIDADCFSLQVDGSVDKYSVDNKFITARFVGKEKNMKNVFLGESHSDKRGAEGLMDAILTNLKYLGIDEVAKKKLSGLTTDGESANTGRKSGLWARLNEYLGRDLLCVWCVAHRSDLAFSDLEASVTEIKHWRINLKAVASYYRASAVRTDELKKLAEESGLSFFRFPEHFEVRFVEHLINLCESVWKNLPSLRAHWNSVSTSRTNTRIEKATVNGFLKLWKEGGDQEYYTALMLDLLRLFEKLQKDSQKSMATLCDIEVSKTAALASVTLMESGPYPGGKEEKVKERQEASTSETGRRISHNQYVTTRRSTSSVRTEIVSGAKEYLSQRLDLEQEDTVKQIKIFLEGKTVEQMINSTRKVVEGLFGIESVTKFSDEVIGHFASENLPVPGNITDGTGKLYHVLKISQPGTVFSKLVQAYLSLTPHSICPERAVSCHTILKGPKQSSYSREAINSRMYIALNSGGTAHFDPRPAVAKFLQKKQRRYRVPDKELYQDRHFVKKFFAKGSSV